MLTLAHHAICWVLVGALATDPSVSEEHSSQAADASPDPVAPEPPIGSATPTDAPPPPPPVEQPRGADPLATPRKAPAMLESHEDPHAMPRQAPTTAGPQDETLSELGAPRKAAGMDERDPRCPKPAAPTAEPTTSMVSRRVQDSPFRRKGFVLALAPGVSGCGGDGDWCNGEQYFALGVPNAAGEVTGIFARQSRPGPSIVVEAGYRPVRILEALVFLQSTYRPQQINVPAMSTVGKTTAFDLSAGLAAMVRPLGYSRFDPFVGFGVGVGFHRARATFTSEEGIERDYAEGLTRALLRTTLGLDIFVVERFALGPRFDYDFFAGGRLCEHMKRKDPGVPAMTRNECQSARDLNALSEVEGQKGPARQLPQFWRFSLDLRTYF